MRITSLVVVSAICLLGCKSKKEEKVEKLKGDLEPVVEKYGEKTKAILAAIPEIGKQAAAAPKVTTRSAVAKKFEFDPNRPLDSGTLVETAQLLVDRTSKAGAIHIEEDLYRKRLNQVMDGTYKNAGESAKRLEADFKRVTNIKQVAAVRVHEVVKPQMGTDSTFKKGHARGDVLIYDVETKKQIGAFPFDASQDDKIDVKKKGAQGNLEHKFHEAVKKAIYDEMAAYLADKPGPASPGREPPPADKPADEKPAEKPADKATEKPAEKPAEKPNDKKKWPTTDKKPTDKAAGGW